MFKDNQNNNFKINDIIFSIAGTFLVLNIFLFQQPLLGDKNQQ